MSRPPCDCLDLPDSLVAEATWTLNGRSITAPFPSRPEDLLDLCRNKAGEWDLDGIAITRAQALDLLALMVRQALAHFSHPPPPAAPGTAPTSPPGPAG